MPHGKMLVLGASGAAGSGALRYFAASKSWQVVGVSRRPAMNPGRAELVSLDLTDREACERVLGKMADVTHITYAAVSESPGLVEGWRSKDQMQRNLSMLRNAVEPIEKVAKNLQHITILQGGKAYGHHLGSNPCPAVERSPRHPHENFYFLQEDWLKERQQGTNWHWTVLRPRLIVGETTGSNMNIVQAIGVYAALLRASGQPLSFPGGAPYVLQATDSDLLARALEWVVLDPNCDNETFNIDNGDVFDWQTIWPAIADALGMKRGAPAPMHLSEEMPKRAAEWARLVEKYNLAAPADIKEFVAESFALADFVFGSHGPMVTSSVKARQAGFTGAVDSEQMFVRYIHRFQELKLLPPPGFS